MATRYRMVLPLRETVTPDLTYPKRRVSKFSSFFASPNAKAASQQRPALSPRPNAIERLWCLGDDYDDDKHRGSSL